MKKFGKVAIVFIIALAWGLCGTAYADNVQAGFDYFATTSATLNFGGTIGLVDFQGKPIGPGNTDTIVERLNDAILPVGGSGATIPIELVALSLQSVNPVEYVVDSFFDVFVTLDMAQSSTGQMTLTHDFPDNGLPEMEGFAVDSFFDVFCKFEFIPVTGGTSSVLYGSNHFGLLYPGPNSPWSHEPIVPEVIGSGNFFPNGLIYGASDGSMITLGPATGPTVPEPASLFLLGTGLAGMIGFGKKRKQKKA